MNSKRRAELQRKLTLNAVPRPPAGLAERIKADIPQYLQPETVPQRFTRSLAFSMRIAASIFVVAGAVLVAVMVSRPDPEKAASTGVARPVIFPPSTRAMAPAADTTTTMAVARTEEVQLDIVQEAPAIVPQLAAARVPPPAYAPQPETVEDDRGDAASGREVAVGGSAYDTVVGGVAAGYGEAAAAEPQRTAPSAPPANVPMAAPPPEPAVAASAPALAPPPPPAVETFSDAARLERRQERTAATMAAAPPREHEAKKDSVFGISVDPQVFHDIRTTLASGGRPAASSVNVEALVNYFAGAPARPPRELRLEVEASPALIPAEGEHAILRFTIDTPAGTGVAASDARVEVVIDQAAVARAQRIGDADPLAHEPALPHGTSVTGLYALEMKPGLRSSQLVATVRLHYLAAGRPETITKFVHGRDLSKSWQRSSRRHRLASLGAVWAESLQGTPAGVDVVKRAQELATQDPADVRARELARAASASAAGGR